MITFDIRKLFPRFLLEDREGYAMAKAIEAGLKEFLAIAQTGLDNWGDVENMPEWRLDEMAWEYSVPYDYGAPEQVKRGWIRNTWELRNIAGTPGGVEKFLGSYLGNVKVEEWWEYADSGSTFRVTAEDGWDANKIAWAVQVIDKIRNLRSVMEALNILPPDIGMDGSFWAGIGLYGVNEIDLGGTDQPDIEDEDFLADELEDYLTDELGVLMTE